MILALVMVLILDQMKELWPKRKLLEKYLKSVYTK